MKSKQYKGVHLIEYYNINLDYLFIQCYLKILKELNFKI